MVFKQRLRIEVFQVFLRRLVRHSKRNAFLVVDGHPVHRAKAIHEWVEDNYDHIRLFSLPSYSAELNPDGILNQHVNCNALGKKCLHSQKGLLAKVGGYLRSRQRQPNAFCENY